jgi:hypothetical protein
MLSMDGPNPQDPRSTQGRMARGANIYLGASMSPHAGSMSPNAAENMQQASLMPQYKKSSLADVARNFLNGSSRQQ